MSKYKYTLEEVKDNLIKLDQKLDDKKRGRGFWVIATRSDFKPIKLKETINGKVTEKVLVNINDIKKELLEGNEQYYIGKKLAYVKIFIDTISLNDPKEFNEKIFDKIKNDSFCGIIVDIYIVDENGEIGKQNRKDWRCIVKFTIDDMMKYKLKFSDAETIMRQVADRLVVTTGFGGMYFKDYAKLVKKKLKNK